MTAERDAILGAGSDDELRRVYAAALASVAGRDPWDVSALRSAFLLRRRELGLLSTEAPVDADISSSPAAWLAGCFDPRIGSEELEEAYAELQDPRFKDVTSRRAQRLLAAREQWFDALGDPEIPEALLDLYRARHMDRSIPLPELESIPDARQGALAIRARYPDLLAADPGVLKPLLAAKLGERLGREARLDQSRLKGKAGVGIGVLIFIIIASFRLLRHCDVLETDEPEKESKGREPITAPEEPLIGIGGGD